MKTKFLFLTLFTLISLISIAQTENFNNVQLPDAGGTLHGNLWFGGQSQSGQTGMRLFGGAVNGSSNGGGYIDVKAPNLTSGLRFRVNTSNGGTERMRINANGNVGIGTASPASRLSVNGKGNAKYTSYFYTKSTLSGASAIYGYAAKPTGTAASTSGVIGRSISGTGYSRGVAGTSYNSLPKTAGRAYGGFFQGGNATSKWNYGVYGQVIGSNHGAAVFGWDKVTAANQSETLANKSYAAFFVGDAYVSGNMGIGIKTPQNKLDVCGVIRGKEVKVESGWCDYVFANDYKMPTIEEEAEFITNKGHLLSFESAEDMKGEIKLGDVTKRQQETIEKLMLYVIELDKEIKALKAQ